MRYQAITFAQDSRPVEKKGEKKPKGGWRTTNGVRKLGRKGVIEADSFGAAATKVSKLISELDEKVQAQILRVTVSIEKSESKAAGNPFAE